MHAAQLPCSILQKKGVLRAWLARKDDADVFVGLVVPATAEAIDWTGCWLREGDTWSWLESELCSLAHL